MKKHFYILFCFALLSCQEQKKQRPANMIPESKMVTILADIHMAEAQTESTIAYPDTALMIFSDLQKAIWEKHGISEDEFRESYNFYTQDLKEMNKLYEIITDTLIAREALYASKGGNEPELKESSDKAVADSIRLQILKKKFPNGLEKEADSGL